ncbi:hypothetical protein HanIR_Chr10g0489371 [Helianthus annuus]|nr:hypothetical protein HanIR_Chr10g0489371 [Helianthus annuus]
MFCLSIRVVLNRYTCCIPKCKGEKGIEYTHIGCVYDFLEITHEQGLGNPRGRT